MSTQTMKVIAGLDIGNGYVKGKALVADSSRDIIAAKNAGTIKALRLDCPSIVSYTTGSNLPVTPTPGYMSDLLNQLDVTITSNAVKAIDDSKRMFVGTRAVEFAHSDIVFDINTHRPKCEESLSTQLIASSIAAAVIEQYYFDHMATLKRAGLDNTGGDIPSPLDETDHDNELRILPYGGLDVECVLGIALPIGDYREYKDRYAEQLKRDQVTVVVHNFGRDITVTIRFAAVAVMAEGAAGAYAISALEAQHPGFLQTILDRSRQDIDKMINEAKEAGQTPAFENIDPGYTGEMLAEARNTISVDVGEGTVNFPVFRDVGGNGMISIESSASINSGYGTALQRVCDKLANSDIAFESRKSLADFMLHEPKTPAAKRMHEAVRRVLDPEIQVLCGDILRRYTQIFSQVGIRTDVIYVYGGGATPLRDVLYPMLVDASTISGSPLPVLYMRSEDSRDLNRNGLFDGASVMAARVWK